MKSEFIPRGYSKSIIEEQIDKGNTILHTKSCNIEITRETTLNTDTFRDHL